VCEDKLLELALIVLTLSNTKLNIDWHSVIIIIFKVLNNFIKTIDRKVKRLQIETIDSKYFKTINEDCNAFRLKKL
jgi:hypothetical protein